MKIKKPIFIIGCPRSGTTLLFRILSESKELWSSYRESHYLWRKHIPDLRDPFRSIMLDASDFKEDDKKFLDKQYHKYTYNLFPLGYLSRILLFRETLSPLFEIYSELVAFFKGLFIKEYRVIDKTPTNTYKVSYIKKAFPDAKFIYITRDGKTNISSLIEAWTSNAKKFAFKFRKFYDYNRKINIRGYNGDVWKFTNPPGWEEYLDSSIEEVCAFQWLSAHEYAQEAFGRMDDSDVLQIKYEDIVNNPIETIKNACNFAELEYSDEVRKVTEDLPMVSMVSKPNPDKWLKNKDKIDQIKPQIQKMQDKLAYSN